MEILTFLVVFVGIVVIHELGHFIFARLFGVRVLEFAIGFGPAVYVKKGPKTAFRVNLIPLGGYVKLAGENPYEEYEEDIEGKFYEKPAWQRLLIALAGPVFSILAGYVIFLITVNTWGVRFAGVDRVIEGSPAWKSGLKPGDIILKINGEYAFDNSFISQEIRKGEEVNLLILRNGEKMPLKVKPELLPPEVELWMGETSGKPEGEFVSLNGIDKPDSETLSKLLNELITVEFSEGSVRGILENYNYAPERYAIGFVFAGLSNVFREEHPPFKKGDVILKIGDIRINGWLDLIRSYTFLSLSPREIYIDILGKDLEWWTNGSEDRVTVQIERDGSLEEFEVSKETLMSIMRDPAAFEPQIGLYRPSGFFERVEMAVARCNWILNTTWNFLSRFRIFKGIASGEVTGPVGIAGIVGEAAEMGMETVLSIVAIITINLGLFNLLPLPALDGGRIVFALLEILTRRKINPKVEGIIHTIGFLLLMAFLAYITFMDIGRIIGR